MKLGRNIISAWAGIVLGGLLLIFNAILTLINSLQKEHFIFSGGNWALLVISFLLIFLGIIILVVTGRGMFKNPEKYID